MPARPRKWVMGATQAAHIRGYFESSHWRQTPGREQLAKERMSLFREIASQVGEQPGEVTICDIGCGGGSDLMAWRNAGVPETALAGTELVAERARIARERLPAADVRLVHGFDLPFTSGSFRICTASLVLSTIRSVEQRRQLFSEMARVTSAGGLMIVYDFTIRKPWNTNVAAIKTRDLVQWSRRPDYIRRAAPLLPLLELALRLPPSAAEGLIALLPRTHRIWAWRM